MKIILNNDKNIFNHIQQTIKSWIDNKGHAGLEMWEYLDMMLRPNQIKIMFSRYWRKFHISISNDDMYDTHYNALCNVLTQHKIKFNTIKPSRLDNQWKYIDIPYQRTVNINDIGRICAAWLDNDGYAGLEMWEYLDLMLGDVCE